MRMIVSFIKEMLFLALVVFSSGCGRNAKLSEHEKELGAPLNVILMIGDGMGVSQITTMFHYKDQPSVFKQFSEIGFINTTSASSKITDSAAAGTAFATGQKSFNRGLGLNTDSLPIPSILSILQQKGYQTGLVSISSITDATPGAFYAKVIDRDMKEEVAKQLVQSGVDFFAGGGLDYFNKRADGVNLLHSFEKIGYRIDTTELSPLGSVGKKYGYLLAPGDLPQKHKGRGDYLRGATQLALEKLSKAPKGFFLMVEGSFIDWAGHAMDKDFLVAEMLDFEDALNVAIQYVDTHDNTLLIVTGDHETGGVSVGKGMLIDQVEISFNTNQHTADLIPVFAKGYGDDRFKGVYENSDLFHKILGLIQ